MASAKPFFRSSSSIMASVKSSLVVKQVLEKEKKKGSGGESAKPLSVEQILEVEEKKGSGGESAKPSVLKSSSVVEQFLEEEEKKWGSVVEEKTKLGPPIILALPAVEKPRRTTIDESSHLMFKKPSLLEKNKPRNESAHLMIKRPPSSLAGHKRKHQASSPNSHFSDDEGVCEFLAATERSMSRHGLIVGSKKPKPSRSSSDQVCHRPCIRVRIRRYDGPCKIVNVFITQQMHQFIRESIRDLTTEQPRAPR